MDITGKKLIEIFETEPSITEGFFDTEAHYFQIILELENQVFVELGLHKIKAWNSNEKLKKSDGTPWATDNKLEYKNQIIKNVIERDSEEYYDGSLTLVLENNVIIEHQGTNGDQLYISIFKDMSEE